MGQLRTALHAYAIEGHGPGRTLELVDRFVQSHGRVRDGDRRLRTCSTRTRALQLRPPGTFRRW